LSTDSRPIKVANTAPSNNTRANEITIETEKTGKVTAVVAVMSIFWKNKCKLQRKNLGDEKLSGQKPESADFPEENCQNQESFCKKQEQAGNQKKQHLY
jgi:hypothetical protein